MSLPYNPNTTFTFQNPKIAQLDKEFLISENRIWEYYQTNSGIYPKNPAKSDSGDDEQQMDSRVKTIEEKISSYEETCQDANEILEQKVIENPTDVDEILSSISALKEAQMKSNTF